MSLLTDARSYGSATLSTDHKITVVRLQLSSIPLVWKRLSRKSNIKFNIQQLCNENTVQEAYNDDLSKRIEKLPPTQDPNIALSQLLTCIRQAARATIGTAKPYKGPHYSPDHIVAKLSQRQKQLRLQIESSTRHRLPKDITQAKNRYPQTNQLLTTQNCM